MIPVSEKKDIPLSDRDRLTKFSAVNRKSEESCLMKLPGLLNLNEEKTPLSKNWKKKNRILSG